MAFTERFGRASLKFQNDSEQWVTDKVVSHWTLWEDTFIHGGFLYKDADDQPRIYLSQVGMQGFIFSIPVKLMGFDAEQTLLFLRILVSLSFASLLTGYCLIVQKEFGWTACLTTAFCISVSYYIIAFGKNLYWVIALVFAPMLVGWMIYPSLSSRKGGKILFYFLISLLVFMKSLCGYEFITNVILGATTPVVYYELLAQPNAWSRVARIVLLTLLAGILGFLGAIALHSVQLLLYTGNVDYLLNRILVRTMGEQYTVCEQNFWWMLLHYLLVIPQVLNPFARFLPIPEKIFPLVLLLGACAASGLILARGNWLSALTTLSADRLNAVLPKVRALNLAVGWAFLCSMSWVILAKNHMGCHYHMNSVVFYLPFGLISFAQIGYLIALTLSGRFNVSLYPSSKRNP